MLHDLNFGTIFHTRTINTNILEKESDNTIKRKLNGYKCLSKHSISFDNVSMENS